VFKSDVVWIKKKVCQVMNMVINWKELFNMVFVGKGFYVYVMGWLVVFEGYNLEW